MSNDNEQSGWQLDERGAEAYERNLVPRFMDPGAATLVDAVDLRPSEHVLDVACGTGIVARHAARRVGLDGRVDAVDVNPAMLAVARRTTAGDGVIALKEATADDLPFPEGSYDVVVCQQGLQFFPDRGAALAEARRVLRPGGRLAVSTCRSIEHQPAYVALSAVVTTHVGVEAAEIVRSPYAFGDRETLRTVVSAAGFHEVDVRTEITTVRFSCSTAFLRAETGSSPLGDLLDQLDEDIRQELTDDLELALDPFTDDRGVVFPFETNVVTATT